MIAREMAHGIPREAKEKTEMEKCALLSLISLSAGLIRGNDTACMDGKHKLVWSCHLVSLP